MTIDEFHNWWDILAGAVIGTTMAFSAYRMVYASVWDFRFNHIPLVRHVPFTYGGSAGFDGFRDAMWTRQAGWGDHGSGSFGGAPFDASDKSSGLMGDGMDMHSRRSNDGRPRQNSIPRRPVPASPGANRGVEMV